MTTIAIAAMATTTTATAAALLMHHRRHSAARSMWSLRNIEALLNSQELSCEQLAQYCYATAVAGEDIWNLRAFSRLCSWDEIQEAAQASDGRRKAGNPKSVLDGIPISVKANLAVKNHPLTAGSRILGEGSSDTPSVGYHSDLVHHLVEGCGAICIGITAMDEFGMGSLGTNVLGGGPTKNPLAFLPKNESQILELSVLDFIRQSPVEISDLHRQYTKDKDGRLGHYSAGGSSCGAAVSVAHGSSLIALGSDTGGSIRLPAAWCGVTGLKTSYGRISRHGLVSYASSLDTVGFLAPSVDCASIIMEQITRSQKQSKRSINDSTFTAYSKVGDREVEDDEALVTGEIPLNGIRVGIPSAFVVKECGNQMKFLWEEAAEIFARAGAAVTTISDEIISPDIIQNSLAAYYVLSSAEASSNLARYDGFRYGVAADTDARNKVDNSTEQEVDRDGKLLQRQYSSTRTHGFGAEVARRILCGTAVLSSDRYHSHYEAAAKLRALLTQQLEEALSKVDYLLIPTAVSSPPPFDELQSGKNVTEMFANDIMTVPISLAGLAAVGVPFRSAETTAPIHDVVGFQLVGRRLDEANLLRVAQYLESLS